MHGVDIQLILEFKKRFEKIVQSFLKIFKTIFFWDTLYMESNIENRPLNNLQPDFKKLSKEVKSKNFSYYKVIKAITLWE